LHNIALYKFLILFYSILGLDDADADGPDLSVCDGVQKSS